MNMSAVLSATRIANAIANPAGLHCAYKAERGPDGSSSFVWLFFRGDAFVAKTRKLARVQPLAEKLAAAK